MSKVIAQCFSCRVKREVKNPEYYLNAIGRRAVKGKCSVCGGNVTKLISLDEGPSSLVAKPAKNVPHNSKKSKSKSKSKNKDKSNKVKTGKKTN